MVPELKPELLTARALLELDRRMPTQSQKLGLYIVGGFALQLWGVRTEVDEATDIDYIGSSVAEYRNLVNAIGFEYGLGNGWLNNDILAPTEDALEMLEASTGRLEFIAVPSPLVNFDLYVATLETLLRLKLIAIDTTLIANDAGSRSKDLKDTVRLISTLQLNQSDVRMVLEDLGDRMFVADPKAVLAALYSAEGTR